MRSGEVEKNDIFKGKITQLNTVVNKVNPVFLSILLFTASNKVLGVFISISQMLTLPLCENTSMRFQRTALIAVENRSHN
jgi:hypothetical protein